MKSQSAERQCCLLPLAVLRNVPRLEWIECLDVKEIP